MTTNTPRLPSPGTEAVEDRLGTDPQTLFYRYADSHGATLELVTLVCNAARAADRATHDLLLTPRDLAGPPQDPTTSVHALEELDRAISALSAALEAKNARYPATNLCTRLAVMGALIEGPVTTLPAGPIHLPTGTITLPDTLTTTHTNGELSLQRDGQVILTATFDHLDPNYATAHLLYAALRTYTSAPTDNTPEAIAHDTLPLAAERLREVSPYEVTTDPSPDHRFPYVRDDMRRFISVLPETYTVYALAFEEDEHGGMVTAINFPDGIPRHWDARGMADLLLEVFAASFL